MLPYPDVASDKKFFSSVQRAFGIAVAGGHSIYRVFGGRAGIVVPARLSPSDYSRPLNTTPHQRGIAGP